MSRMLVCSDMRFMIERVPAVFELLTTTVQMVVQMLAMVLSLIQNFFRCPVG